MSHEPGPITWHPRHWTETRLCETHKCGKVAVYEMRTEGWWPHYSCWDHTPAHGRQEADA